MKGKQILILFFTLIFPAILVFAAGAPLISNVKVSEIEPTKAIIEWETDVDADATLNYGLADNAGVVRDPSFKQKHAITVDKLLPSTKYHFIASSINKDGDQTRQGGFIFTTESFTDPAELSDVPADDRALVDLALYTIERIESEEALSAVAEGARGELEETVGPPVIIGEPTVVADTDTALIRWGTNRESNSMVHFAPEADYDPDASDSYTLQQGNSNERVLDHRVTLIGLEPATEYHYKVVSEDAARLAGESEDFTFRTQSELPEIRNVRVQKIEETSATIAWSTEVPASGFVEYTNTRTRVSRSSGDLTVTTAHQVQLTELEFGTRYSARIRAVNEAGDEIVSDPFSFVTVRDEAAPLISKVSNESTLFPGGEGKIQTIVSWETDESSVCQLFYHQGLVAPDDDQIENLPIEGNPVVAHVQVIVGFSPGTVYRFWMECLDNADNKGRSEDFVLFTPVQEKNIVDLILENFEGTFGWVKNITG